MTPLSSPVSGWFRAIYCAHLLITLNRPTRFTSTTKANFFKAVALPSLSSTLQGEGTPAQLTLIWMAPNFCKVASIAAATDASLVTSVVVNKALSTPSSATAALPASSLRSKIDTRAPLSTKYSAVARPKPEAPPVITTTLSCSSIASTPFCLVYLNAGIPVSALATISF